MLSGAGWMDFMGLEIPMSEVHSPKDVLRYMEKCQPGQNPEIFSKWMRERAKAFLKEYHDQYLVRLKEIDVFWRTKFLGITEPEAESSGESKATSQLACPASQPVAGVNPVAHISL